MASAPPPTPLRRLGVKDERVEHILLWKNPTHSGAVLGGLSAAFVFLTFAKINVVATAAWVGLIAVLGCFLWNNAAGFIHKPPVPVPRLLREGVSETQVKAVADGLNLYLNKVIAVVHRLLRGREPMLSGAVAVVLYVVARLASTFSLLGLVYGVVLLLFSVPKSYEMRKAEIDGAVDHMRVQVTSTYDRYLHKWVQKIPRAGGGQPAESTSATSAKKEE